MRDLILSAGPWSASQRQGILDYCESDVIALADLLTAMLPQIDWTRALLRGQYMQAVSRIQTNGVPLDVHTLDKLLEQWDSIQDQLIADVDQDYGVYNGRTFKDMARAYPQVTPMHELRVSLSAMRLFWPAGG